MNKTPIDWVKNPDGTQGYTWNPITGCLNGCEYCYARKLANGRLRSRYLANPIIIGNEQWKCAHTPTELTVRLNDPFYPRFWPKRFDEIHDKLQYAKPRGIFTCDMSDLFGIGVPEKWTGQVLTAIRKWGFNHRFYLLTKQPQNLIKFSPFPDNCFVGVTVTNQLMLVDALIRLWHIKAKVKFISFEPLLNQISIVDNALEGISWLIIGAQTNPYKPPRIEWVEEIVRAADKAGIPVFLKDNLTPLLRDNVVSWKPDPHYLLGGILRQELPK